MARLAGGNRRSIRVLLSEGSSLSARQTITALGRRGYALDVCDPNPRCLARFSRFVRRVHRCPAAGADPAAYLSSVLDLLTRHRYDVLLPVHEQAFLFAGMRDRLPPGVGVALAAFDAFGQVQGKVAFTHLLERLGLPHPPSRVVHTGAELAALDRYPCYLKADHGTAGQGVWRLRDAGDRERAVTDIERHGLLDARTAFVVQDEVVGELCQAQAVFVRGRPVGLHCTQTRGMSAGGGHSARTSVDHPIVREHVVKVGEALSWHGPLALDYVVDATSGQPAYIEANPRLVEPMNAALSGVDLADLTVRVALGEIDGTDDPPHGRPGVRSHSLMANLLGVAAQDGSRRALLRSLAQAAGRRGIYRGSREDLTPVRADPASILPLGLVVGWLLLRPTAAREIAAGAVGAYSLSAEAVRAIHAMADA